MPTADAFVFTNLADHKLSKYETLQMAQTYIGALASLMERAAASTPPDGGRRSAAPVGEGQRPLLTTEDSSIQKQANALPNQSYQCSKKL